MSDESSEYWLGNGRQTNELTENAHRSADHDIDDSSNTQITVYSARGLFVESTSGSIWLVGTAVEHHVLYNYQFYNTKNVYAAQLQTETPYYQPSPNSLEPFAINGTLNDPTFNCTGVSGNCDVSWGLRIISSSNVLIYGANHYSFFDDYEQSTPIFSYIFMNNPILYVYMALILTFLEQPAQPSPTASHARRASCAFRVHSAMSTFTTSTPSGRRA